MKLYGLVEQQVKQLFSNVASLSYCNLMCKSNKTLSKEKSIKKRQEKAG